ncbi:MAG: hypothetical protein ACOYL6_10690 [Bacteriovoracaceae bacterium]
MKSLFFAIFMVMSTHLLATDQNAEKATPLTREDGLIQQIESDEKLSSKAKRNLEIKAEKAKERSWSRQEKAIPSKG